MSRISKSSIQEVYNRLDAVSVVQDYISIEKKGGRFWGRCPFHAGGQERTPSFTINPEDKLYYCYGCRKGGNIIGFVMEMEKISYPEAVKTLARKFSVELIYDNDTEEDSRDREAENTRREELHELYRRTTLAFSHFLLEKPEGKTALDYLYSRKINTETISRFRLGFSGHSSPARNDFRPALLYCQIRSF